MCLTLLFFCRLPAQMPSLIDEDHDAYMRDPVLNNNENAEEKIRKNIFIKVTTNKNSCFVGEPVLVTYQLYSAIRSSSKVSKQPSFSNCSVVELTTDQPPVIQKVDDRYYRVFLIRKVELIPLKQGDLQMDIASVDNDVTFFSKENPYQSKTVTTTINSEPLKVEVKALPKDMPQNFSGVVGKFNIRARVDSNRIPKGENNSLKISITGDGNIPAISSPQIIWPASLEHFDIKDTQNIDKMSFPMHGTRTFEIPFISTKEGKIIIPKISFTYFNPSASAYETVYTDSIPLLVTHALAKSNEFKDIVTEDVSNRKYLWIVPAIALTVAFVWIISSKTNSRNRVKANDEPDKKENIPASNIKPSKPKTDFRAELNSLSEITDTPAFFSYVKALLKLALQQKMQTSETEDSVLLHMLNNASEDKEVVKEAEDIFNVCNFSLYTPVMEDNVKHLVHSKFNNLIERLAV